MKFNDREIVAKGAGKVDLEGCLNYQRPVKDDWSNWYSAPSFKERKFKLVSNLLFYYRLGESEPLGVFVLENLKVQLEKSASGVIYPFSIEFADEADQKHIFSCRSQDEAILWVNTLKNASYEYWRTQLVILQKKISMRTGQDPSTIYSTSQGVAQKLEWSKRKCYGARVSSFRCHLETAVLTEDSDVCKNHVTYQVMENTPKTVDMPNLIEF